MVCLPAETVSLAEPGLHFIPDSKVQPGGVDPASGKWVPDKNTFRTVWDLSGKRRR